jgi:hypothetical protein
MRKQLPVIVGLIAGLVFIVQFFSPALTPIQERFTNWYIVVSVFAFVLGLANLIKINLQKIQRREENWPYAFPLLIALVAMAALSFIFGIEKGPFVWLFNNMMLPMSATMFSLLAFFVASASYRAFRARHKEAAMLLVTAIVVMLGQVPIGAAGVLEYLRLSEITNWIMAYPNMAAQRAILIGAALGVVAISLRILLGIERAYLGED